MGTNKKTVVMKADDRGKAFLLGLPFWKREQGNEHPTKPPDLSIHNRRSSQDHERH